jgi:trimethylamine:corrinoid methyltransferase-like protein
MTTASFEVLTQQEVERMHAVSMEILATLGIQVECPTARDLLQDAGATLDDSGKRVRIPEKLVNWSVEQAPGQFTRLNRWRSDSSW